MNWRAFDTVIVVTDRRVLDKQIRNTIKQFAQVSSIVGAVTEGSQQLRTYFQQGKKIIITTVQKFPFILDEIGDGHRGRTFAIIIDDAHSSQGGRTSAKMNIALAANGAEEEEETVEDTINRLMEARPMAGTASPLDLPLHPNLGIMAQRRRGLLQTRAPTESTLVSNVPGPEGTPEIC